MNRLTNQLSQTRMQSIFDAALDAKTSKDVERVIERMGNNIKWVPFGGNPGNFGIISMGIDPYDGITERCTNAMDAMIELKAELDVGLKAMASPRQVVEQSYKIKQGSLKNATDLELGKISKDVKVRFLDSEDSQAPTIEIRDKGIGQHPIDFANTLLGLNRDYKLSKFYLIGSFGQGGQTSFANCKYGIIISRRCPQLLREGMADSVGWSVVRYRDPSTQDQLYKHGLWEYCVDSVSGEVPQVRPSEIRFVFEHGTIIRLIAYSMPKGTSDTLQPSGSAWSFLSQSLFDPILPIRLSEERSRYQNRERPLSGLAVRLWRGGKGEKAQVVLDNSYPVDLEANGRITVNYWALKPTVEPGGQAKWRDVKKGFVSGNNAIFVTLNGQRHAVEQANFLRDEVNLPYSYDYVVVQVDCDELSNFAKKNLVPTTRVGLREGHTKDLILSEIANILRNDRNLLAFEKERKDEILTARTEKDTSKIRALVGRYIAKNPELSQLIQNKGTEKDESKVQRKERHEKDEEELIEERELEQPQLKAVPSFLKVANRRNPIPVEKGGTCLIRLETDVEDAYLEGERASMFRCIHGSKFTSEKSCSKLRAGKISYYVHCHAATRVGTAGTLTFELDLPDGSVLSVVRDIVCIEPIKRQTKKGEAKIPEPRIECVKEGDPLWKTLEYDQRRVGEVRLGAQSMIVVSLSNAYFVAALKSRPLEINLLSSVEDRYGAAIAYYLLLREISLRKENKPAATQEQDGNSSDELDRLARTVALLALPPEPT